MCRRGLPVHFLPIDSVQINDQEYLLIDSEKEKAKGDCLQLNEATVLKF